MPSPELIAFGKHVLAARTAKGWTGAQLAHEALGNQDRKGFVSQVEQGKRTLSALTIQKFAKALQLPETVVNPLLGLELPADDTPPDTLPENDKLEDVTSLNRDQLLFLAEQFEIEDAEELSLPKLQHLLTQKAEEYRSYRDQIDALDDRIAGVHNLKAAAQDAADRLNFDEVEELLARVDMVETEIMAETKEARAANALLRGRVEQAYAIFTAAAESFRELNILEMAKRRNIYFSQLYGHGVRYGDAGLSRAIDILRPCIDSLEDTRHRKQWAGYLQNLAIALQEQGKRTSGAERTQLLAEAIDAYRDALSIRTRAENSEHWAITTQNLAIALQLQGTRTKGKAGKDLLAQSVTAFCDALTVLNPEDHPIEWAKTNQNRAIALKEQGNRTKGEAGLSLLAAAATAYREALLVFTKEDHREYWAGTTQNIATVLRDQGTRTDGKAGADLLEEAITVYRDALTVYTREDHPEHWALTTQNLAIALKNLGTRTDGEAGRALLKDAVVAYRDALTVRTRKDHPLGWALAKRGMAMAEEALADHPTTTDPAPNLRAALNLLVDALSVVDAEHKSFEHDQCAKLRDRIQAKLDALDDDAEG